MAAAAMPAKKKQVDIRLLYSIYLLYWYKSTNTDAEGAAGAEKQAEAGALGQD